VSLFCEMTTGRGSHQTHPVADRGRVVRRHPLPMHRWPHVRNPASDGMPVLPSTWWVVQRVRGLPGQAEARQQICLSFSPYLFPPTYCSRHGAAANASTHVSAPPSDRREQDVRKLLSRLKDRQKQFHRLHVNERPAIRLTQSTLLGKGARVTNWRQQPAICPSIGGIQSRS
jgi:hypothetical protein